MWFKNAGLVLVPATVIEPSHGKMVHDLIYRNWKTAIVKPTDKLGEQQCTQEIQVELFDIGRSIRVSGENSP